MEQSKQVLRGTITKIEQLEDFDDEYVYDIGIKGDTPYFFANNILVHNSSYFSAAPVMDAEMSKDMTNDDYIALYDEVAEQTNASFAGFMDRTFNTGLKRGSVIAAGRELVASRALFIKKKKYACLLYEFEGERFDRPDKKPKLKVMGLDLKRADTPAYMQKFLEEVLMDVLTGGNEKSVLKKVADFRTLFKTKPAWEKGSPKKVSNLSTYGSKKKMADQVELFNRKGIANQGKVNLPEHVLASIQWNALLDRYGDRHSMRITDGSRIIVCKMKPNNMNIRAVAYPVDEPHLPEWFKEMPFNVELMETTIIDKKISNLLGVLEWNLANTHNNDVDDLIVF